MSIIQTVENLQNLHSWYSADNKQNGREIIHYLCARSVNDPWKPISSSGAGEPDSIDPFSPQAQSQLAEFDVLRNQIETKDLAERNILQTNSSIGNNEGKLISINTIV